MGAASKTEKPTPKRIEDARKKGQVARSNDLNGAIVLTTASLLMVFIGPYSAESLIRLARFGFSEMLLKAMTPDGFTQVIIDLTMNIFWIILPFFMGVLVMAILGNLFQIKPMFSPAAIQPKLDKISPIGGFKRLWSTRSLVETLKAILKMVVIGFAATTIIWNSKDTLFAVGQGTPMSGMQSVMQVLGLIAGVACVIFLALGIADFMYQKYEMEKQLRMSRQEIKDEHKNMDGDPQMKRRIRETGMMMARKKQLVAVQTADVVITNPTHLSVAIKYDPDLGPAPRVVAKGQEHFAFKMREIAKQYNVPVIENKPVARALYTLVDVDHMVPPELFVTVAEVLAYVFSRKKGRRMPRRKPTA